MGFRMITGTIAQILLLFIILPLLALLLGWIPGGVEMVEQVFWEFVDTIDIFEGWVQLLNQYVTSDGVMIPPDQAMATVLNMFSRAFLEAMLIGFCVSIALWLCTVVTQNWRGIWQTRYSVYGLPLLPAFCGVLAGVILLKVFAASASELIIAIALPMGTIVLMLIGIGLMLGLPHRSSAINMAGAVSMLINVSVGAVISVCVCGMTTALTQISVAVNGGLNVQVVLGWYFILLAITLLLLALIGFIQKLEG